MKKKVFIGIDFSKKKFDAMLVYSDRMDTPVHNSFENTKSGCEDLLAWLKSETGRPDEEWLFCGEHTGLYGVTLCEFLIRKKLFIRMENPLQIKLSSGVKRGKNDKADSLSIALYACRYQDRAKAYQLPCKALHALSLLLSFRHRLLANKHALLVAAKEVRSVYQRDATARYIYERSRREIEHLNKEIKAAEAKMEELIRENEEICRNYERVSSIKGIALINTVAILVATQNFTTFDTSRQFACYAGLAPFGKQTGSSLNTAPHVSHIANKKIKVLLTQAARCAVRCDPVMRNYYRRKIAEGKPDWLVINNVRNKLVHLAFALVRNKQLYQAGYTNRSPLMTG